MYLDTNKVLSHYNILPNGTGGAKTQYKCPLHKEQNGASFTVFDDGGWYCFGKCAHGGTAIDFIAEYENLDKGLAQKKAEQIFGVKLGPVDDRKEKFAHLYQVGNELAAIYHAELQNQPEIIEYLEKRGYKAEQREHWQIGYALASHVMGDPARFELLAEAGLLHKKDVYSPVFDRRIVFPIRDTYGDVIGFTGRVDPRTPKDIAEKLAKYKNTPTTPIFIKNEVMFGLYELTKAKLDTYPGVSIVEGAFDGSLCQDFQIPAVAFLGLGSNNLAPLEFLLRRFKHNVVLMFDGDEAGYKRAFTLAAKLFGLLDQSPNERIAVGFLPEGKDPDEILLENGTDAILNVLKESLPIEEYVVRQIIAQAKKESILADRRAFMFRTFAQELTSLPRTVAGSYYDRIYQETGIDVHGRYVYRTNQNKSWSPQAASQTAAVDPAQTSGYSAGIRKLRDAYNPIYVVRTDPKLLDAANLVLSECGLPTMSPIKPPEIKSTEETEIDWDTIKEKFALAYQNLMAAEKPFKDHFMDYCDNLDKLLTLLIAPDE